MKLHSVAQGTPEWHALRVQYPLTASKAQAIATGGKGLETLVWEKMTERYSTAEKENYTNEHMERGNELEAHARSLYELETGTEVEEIGFVTNEDISPIGGASPDGAVKDTEGLIEIKSCNDIKHFQMIVDGAKADTAHEWQVQQQMLFMGKEWTDLVYFNPNFQRSLIIIRIKADKEKQDKILAGLKKGEELINTITKKLK